MSGRPRQRPGGRGRKGAGGPRGTGRARGSGGPRGLGGDQIEGRQAVRELLLAGRRRVIELLVEDNQHDRDILDEILDLADGARAPIRKVSAGQLSAAALTASPQGVVARAGPLQDVPLDELTATTGRERPFLLVFDGVTDPGNLGAALRSAEGAGVTGVVLPRHRAVHISPAVTKSAAGAVEYLRYSLVAGVPQAIDQLKAAGIWVVGLDGGGDETIHDLKVADQPLALVLGAEGRGLTKLVRRRCDVLARIPMRGQLASLNVSAASALACFEVRRQRDSAD